MGKLPDFLILGAAKAGTSFLFELLAGHPEIEVKRDPEENPAVDKEKHYFDTPRYQQRSLQWYKNLFPDSGVTGEASPYYLFAPRVPSRVAATIPRVRLIVILRDPVERAFSEYRHKARREREDLSFEDALKAEAGRIAGERERMEADDAYYSKNLRRYSYRTRGIYVDQLREWHEHFPAEQILVLTSRELFSEPLRTAAKAFAHLGLENAAIEVPPAQNAAEPARMKPLTRLRLRRFYRPHNTRLYEYLGKDLGFS